MQKEGVLNAVEIPPSTNLIRVLSNSGYTIEAAIADIIDNSIAHKANRIEVSFRRKGPASTVEILDDGEGMDNLDLQKAMTFAYRDIDENRSENDLGRYGVGMKTASSSFCDRLLVESKVDGKKPNAYEFPFKSKEWKIFHMRCEEDCIPFKSGTRITWKELRLSNEPSENKRLLTTDVNEFSRIVERVASHLSRAFGLYIKNGLTIIVNDNQLEGWDPLSLPGDSDLSVLLDTCVSTATKEKIRLKSILLPPSSKMSDEQMNYATCQGTASLTDLEGFYVYRDNRLIVCGGWLKLPGLSKLDHYRYTRIGLWFDSSPELDSYFRVNFIKDSISVPADFAKTLLTYAQDGRKKSATINDSKGKDRPYRRRKRNEENINVWEVSHKEHSLVFTINPNHPLVEQYTEGLNKHKKDALFALLEKEFPFEELAQNVPKRMEYTEEELKKMLEERFYNLKKQDKLTTNQIEKLILKEQPFCEDKYFSKCEILLKRLLTEGNDNGCL